MMLSFGNFLSTMTSSNIFSNISLSLLSMASCSKFRLSEIPSPSTPLSSNSYFISLTPTVAKWNITTTLMHPPLSYDTPASRLLFSLSGNVGKKERRRTNLFSTLFPPSSCLNSNELKSNIELGEIPRINSQIYLKQYGMSVVIQRSPPTYWQ